MSEATHTPGPWFVGAWNGQCHIDHKHGGGNCKFDYSLIVDDYFSRHVSAGDANNTLEIAGSDEYGPVLTRANARLIAAAPDMLAALHNVRSLISEASMTGFNCNNGDWAERLFASQQVTSAAIGQAEGRP